MASKNDLIQSLIDGKYLRTPRIIDAFRAIDRADFVTPEHKSEAYGNYPLPIGHGQTISQPLTVAFMLELLDPQPGEKILDIGTGSGWTTALLAYIVGEKGKVSGIERIKDLCEFGQRNLAKYFAESRTKIICGDGTLGLLEQAPFDKILAGAAALKKIPEAWRKQLKVGGKIVTPTGGSIWLLHKRAKDQREEKEFPGFAFVPLVTDKNPKPQLKTKVFFIILAAVISLTIGFFANEIYRPHTDFHGSRSVEIPAGLGSRKIAELLKKEGIIRSKWVFMIYVSLKGRASSLKPGTYSFGQYTIPEIVRDLVRGEPNERIITIPEGWNLKDVGEYLEKENISSAAGFETASKNKKLQEKFDFLKDKPATAGLEGYLFPDTYRIFKGAGAEEIIIKMLENFDKKLTLDLRAEISRQSKSVFEIVTMASLIEKEVVSDEDRALVSGILWKRLKMGMALQVDASVNYITGKKTPRVSKKDTAIDSPYNTYKYRGLPKGPITNPGISAIRAAIYPKVSLYLYYLSAPDGRTIFSKTLEEHNLAKTKYLPN